MHHFSQQNYQCHRDLDSYFDLLIILTISSARIGFRNRLFLSWIQKIIKKTNKQTKTKNKKQKTKKQKKTKTKKKKKKKTNKTNKQKKKPFPVCFMPEASLGPILTKKSLNELDISSGSATFFTIISFKNTLLTSRFASSNNYIILDGIEGCMGIYCTRHDDIHRAVPAR